MKRILLITLLLFSLKISKAQNYTFTQTNINYNTISGGTVISTNGWDYYDTFIVPFPFQFNFYGASFDTFYVSGGFGGFEYFGSGLYGDYQVLFYDAPVMDQGFGLSPISYVVTGTAPNRVVILQIENGGFMYDPNLSDYFEVQVWFYETTNVIEFHYGPSDVQSADSWYTGYDGPTVALLKDTGTFIQLYGPADNATASTIFVTDYVTGSPSVTEVYMFSPATTGIEKNDKLNVSVFPNPSNGHFTVNISELNESEFNLYDLSGRLVYSQKINSTISHFDLKLSPGIYLARIICGKKQYTRKIILTE